MKKTISIIALSVLLFSCSSGPENSAKNFTENLAKGKVEEAKKYATESAGTMLDLLTAETSWLEPVLAEHYGVTMAEAGYSSVPGRTGGGLLTTAAFLTGTSSTTRTSPVRRGHWVVNNIMCEEPPPAPDGVEQEFDQSEGANTIAEQLAEHRSNPACAVCHDQMDPIGVALESFNAVGLFRTVYDDGTTIETSGELAGIGSFTSVAELASALSGQARTHRCMVQKGGVTVGPHILIASIYFGSLRSPSLIQS